VPGRVARYLVDEGDHVTKGQALVELDDREYRAAADRERARLASAKARAELARAQLARGRELRARDSLSMQELDVRNNELALSQAAIGEASAALREAELDLENTVLRAPSDGVILAKLKEAGEIAVPGGFSGSGDLVRLANMTEVRAEVDINESDLPRIRMGQRAEVTPDALSDTSYPASVVKLYPQVDRQKGTLKVEVRLDAPDARLLPDMSARVAFLGDVPAQGSTGPQVLVPANAMHRAADGRSYVWVVENGRARQAYVDQSGLLGDSVRVASGLRGDEELVIGEPPARDGQRVQRQP
jgi:RND family efflux transporter MFP subunit